MIFIDSNIPMYLIGANHPHKLRVSTVLEDFLLKGERLVTSAEVMQEILHRFSAIERRDLIEPALTALLTMVDEVISIGQDDCARAHTILLRYPALSARDALHAAVMQINDIDRIFSFDRGFDVLPHLKRIF